ncbi:MAG TPA: amidohydrolase [Longimicrobiales bacterium]|nr:amidohydrolase [Longimicrobiales bacterium]
MQNRIWMCCAVVGLLSAAPAPTGQQAPVDLVIVNAKVLTVDPKNTEAEAVAIRGNTFAAVGTAAAVRKMAGPETRVIDAGGRTVVPGFIESHVHATGAARGEVSQAFVQLHSIQEIMDWVRARAREVGPGGWVRLPRVDVTRIREGRLPNKRDLDEAAPASPTVYTWQYANRNIQVLNDAAITAAQIGKATVAPEGCTLHFTPNGEFTGRMENCQSLLDLPQRPVTDAQYLDSLAALLKRYNEVGITSITERSSNADGFRDYQQLHAQGRLPLRARITIRIGTGDNSEAAFERIITGLGVKYDQGDDWVRVGPLKIGIDGGALYGTAVMREPYPATSHALYGITDPQYSGEFGRGQGLTAEGVRNYVRVGNRLGWQLSSHVTGDRGVDIVLDAIEAANKEKSMLDKRYNLIHAYFASADTARRAASLGAVVDTQPMWFYKDGDALMKALGAKYMNTFIGVKTWKDNGVTVALNADHMQGFDPVGALNPYHPMLAMQAAITRRTQGGQVIGPAERISRLEALRMTTFNAAFIGFEEQKKGSIEVGKLADLAILTGDFLTVPEDQIMKIKSYMTIVDGKVVHEAK